MRTGSSSAVRRYSRRVSARAQPRFRNGTPGGVAARVCLGTKNLGKPPRILPASVVGDFRHTLRTHTHKTRHTRYTHSMGGTARRREGQHPQGSRGLRDLYRRHPRARARHPLSPPPSLAPLHSRSRSVYLVRSRPTCVRGGSTRPPTGARRRPRAPARSALSAHHTPALSRSPLSSRRPFGGWASGCW